VIFLGRGYTFAQVQACNAYLARHFDDYDRLGIPETSIIVFQRKGGNTSGVK
jgi:hypothetical protein